MTETVKITTTGDDAAAIDAIVLAFAADPAARWTWPDPHSYLEHFPRLVRAFGGQAFERGTAYRVEGSSAGAALWLPPGVGPDEAALLAIFDATVPPNVRDDLHEVFEQMGSYHPREPHWYLPLIGVDPSRQGRGYGGALLRPALAACDRDGTIAYLESSNPRNVPLYERHGFEILGSIQCGTSPRITPMLRKPR